jgi:hypothetical protein
LKQSAKYVLVCIYLQSVTDLSQVRAIFFNKIPFAVGLLGLFSLPKLSFGIRTLAIGAPTVLECNYRLPERLQMLLSIVIGSLEI